MEFTIPQIEMYLSALHRREARQAVLALDVVASGVAPSMAKNGYKIYSELRKILQQSQVS